MPGTLKMGTNGRVCLNSSGQAIQCACKCAAHCNIGTTPKSYTITSTLIAIGACAGLCLGADTNGRSTKISTMPTASFNGTWTLDQYTEFTGLPTTENCLWTQSTGIDHAGWTVWNGTSCGADHSSAFQINDPSSDIKWTVTRAPSQWILYAATVLPQFSTNYNAAFAFFGTLSATEPSDCSGTLTFTNIITACQYLSPSSTFGSFSNPNFAIASGGSVVCTPNF